MIARGVTWAEIHELFPYCKAHGLFDNPKADFLKWGFLMSKETELEAATQKEVDDLNKRPNALTDLDLRLCFLFVFLISYMNIFL